MQHIIEGFLNFQKEIFPQRKELFRSLASSQNPKALFISCSDSRLVPELVTQQEPGQLFVIRNAGNIVPSFGPEPGGVSATIEYAVVALGVTDIVICGHSNCGAMKAIATCQCLEPMPAVSHWLRYADAAKAVVEKACRELALLVEPVARALHMEDGVLALTGSILLRDKAVREGTAALLRMRFPGMRLAEPKSDAAAGAALLALETLNTEKGENKNE